MPYLMVAAEPTSRSLIPAEEKVTVHDPVDEHVEDQKVHK
jgi:hypothetical protein